MSLETTVPCSSRRWGDDEEAEGQSSDAAPIALHGHGGGKEEAAEGRGGEAKGESGASPDSFLNERLEKLGIVRG